MWESPRKLRKGARTVYGLTKVARPDLQRRHRGPMEKGKKSRRRYDNTARAAAAEKKRYGVIKAAASLLRSEESISDFSLEAVAHAAGVTRLTVYNQFGSRRGLLEAVFDEIAREGGLDRIPDAISMRDPRVAFDRLIEIFCEFWSEDPAIGRLQEAMSTDPEFARALAERNDRRRQLFGPLIGRIAAVGVKSRLCRDATDLIFVLTSYPAFAMLRRQRSPQAAARLVSIACNQVLDKLISHKKST
jgi:AcrR family transcriptional regulator